MSRIEMRIVGMHDERTLIQLEGVAEHAEHVALMADGHVGYVMPIGGVAAYRGRVSPIGVGVDIACGNAAIRTELRAEDIRAHLEDYADEIIDVIGFGMGRPTNKAPDAPTDDPLFESSDWEAIPARLRGTLKERARAQLGTCGGGNHYVDVFADEEGSVWVGVHFGSRGLGHIAAHGFVALAQDNEWTDLHPKPRSMNSEVLLDLETPLGHDYWTAMNLAGRYAYAGREWVCRKVVSILGGTEQELVHNHHNFAWKEQHFEEEWVIVRKGATPAHSGQLSFVGGSMGDKSVILRGTPGEGDEDLLRSTVHGAGRVMGRMQAKGKWRRGRCVREGRVTQEMMDRATEGLVLRGGDLDEAPQVYRKLDDVLAAQGDTIEVVHTLRPLIVCMAPRRTR